MADHKIDFVEKVFGFFFEGSFREKFEAKGRPEDHLRIWFLNAQVFSRLTMNVSLTREESFNLLTLIEAARFELEVGRDFPMVNLEFDFTGYQYPQAFMDRWRERIIAEVMAQEGAAGVG